jgi:ribonuclease D
MIPHPEQVLGESQPHLPPPVVVDTPVRLGILREALHTAPRLAIDTESNSLYAYRERVCLIQISTDQADFLLDPLAFADLEALDFLGQVFSNPAVEKVLHAAEYDVMVLRRDFGFELTHIFDTSLAARILGWHEIGLGTILETHFGVHTNKRHQRANWGIRPLAPDLIRYAQQDIHYLLALRDRLYAALETSGYLEESRELSQEIAAAVWSGGQFDPEGFWRIAGARSLSSSGAAVLRELYLYREGQASHFNLPVFKILADSVLAEIAARMPRSIEALRRIHGMTEGQVRRYGRGLLGAVEHGLAGPPLRPSFKRNGRDDVVARRFDALHVWRKERAARRGVVSDIIMSKDALHELARIAPRSREQLSTLQNLGPWRLKMYGDEVLQVLAEVDRGQKLDP